MSVKSLPWIDLIYFSLVSRSSRRVSCFRFPHSNVSCPLPQTEDMGVPHQDEDTMAAITVSHHPDTGSLLLVSAAA